MTPPGLLTNATIPGSSIPHLNTHLSNKFTHQSRHTSQTQSDSEKKLSSRHIEPPH